MALVVSVHGGTHDAAGISGPFTGGIQPRTIYALPVLSPVDAHRCRCAGLHTDHETLPAEARQAMFECHKPVFQAVSDEIGQHLPQIRRHQSGPVAGLEFHFQIRYSVFQEAAGALAKIAGIADPQGYALDMLQAGSAINSMTADEITHGDMKEFDFPQGKVTVAQVNVMDGEKAKAKWPELQKSLQAMVDKGEADTSLLMVTDIMDEVTELLWAGKNRDILDKAFGQAEADGHYHLPKVLSRKKQIVPPLTDAFKG